MSTPSDDNLIDQSLRDVFRDYDLPPDAHPRVWAGVAERIAVLPAPASGTGPSSRFLLPLVAVVGIGIGWLLPHPATLEASKPATVATHIAAPTAIKEVEPTAPSPLLSKANSTIDNQLITQPAIRPQVAGYKQPAAARQQQVSLHQSATPTVLDSATTAAVQAAVTPEVMVPVDTAPASVAPVPVPPMHMALPIASTPAQPTSTGTSAKMLKPTGTNEKIVYRKLSQRQPEGRRGVGRWFTRFFQGVRHLLK